MNSYLLYAYLASVSVALAALLRNHFYDGWNREISLRDLICILAGALTPIVNLWFVFVCLVRWFEDSALLDFVVWRKRP